MTFALAVAGAQARQASGSPEAERQITISGLTIVPEGDYVGITFMVGAGRKAVKGNQMIRVTPVLTSGGQRYELQSVAVRGHKSYISQKRRARAAGTALPNHETMFIDNGDVLKYKASLPESAFAPGATLVFESSVRQCCYAGEASVQAADGFVTVRTELVMPQAEDRTSVGDMIAHEFPFVENIPQGGLRFTEEMREKALVVYFELNTFELKPGFRNNAAILSQILSAINVIQDSDDSEVVSVMLAGFASPEGSAANNERLASGRSAAMRDYITRNTGLAGDKFVIHNGGGDWDGLRRMVAGSDMPRRQQVLDIIDTTPEMDSRRNQGRMGKIQALDGGDVYRYMQREFFPNLRNAAYIKVYYRNK